MKRFNIYSCLFLSLTMSFWSCKSSQMVNVVQEAKIKVVKESPDPEDKKVRRKDKRSKYLSAEGEGRSPELTIAKKKAFDNGQEAMLQELLVYSEQVLNKYADELGVTEKDKFLLELHAVLEKAIESAQIDIHVAAEAVEKMDNGNYRFMIDVRLPKSSLLKALKEELTITAEPGTDEQRQHFLNKLAKEWDASFAK